MTPVVSNLRRHAGVAGQFSVTADVTHEDGETNRAEFVGSVYGEPGVIVMVLPSGVQTFVTDPGRFGLRFDTDWVLRFLTQPV